ncbi:hypothetical protein [uncultured Duncaniella sp.]|uniref:hypothetical protein n=1 Tax=uncultured Duncaniella sp. TaxID=2768039 RepID=UPI0026385131|nr:hypothetical protein [uncultured Duncaniella sp.]
MKHFIITLQLILAIFVFSNASYARDNEDLLSEGELEVLRPVKNTKGHEKPGRIFIGCRYSARHLHFIMPSHINTLQVAIGKDDAPIWQTFVTVENPECDIPELYGEYEITCRTDGNQIFKGKLQFAN